MKVWLRRLHQEAWLYPPDYSGLVFHASRGRTAVDDVSFRLTSYDIFAFSGCERLRLLALEPATRKKKKETQKEGNTILNFVSLSSSIWEQDHSDAIPPVELTSSLFVMAFHEKIVAYRAESVTTFSDVFHCLSSLSHGGGRYNTLSVRGWGCQEHLMEKPLWIAMLGAGCVA
jgi:hypothetical protein